MPTIKARYIQQRIAFLQVEIDKVEAERAETVAKLEALNTRGLQLLGQKAEAEFWGKVLVADDIAEVGE